MKPPSHGRTRKRTASGGNLNGRAGRDGNVNFQFSLDGLGLGRLGLGPGRPGGRGARTDSMTRPEPTGPLGPTRTTTIAKFCASANRGLLRLLRKKDVYLDHLGYLGIT
jgi:hypothetical protein